MFSPDDDEIESDWPPAPKMEHIEMEHIAHGCGSIHYRRCDDIEFEFLHKFIDSEEEFSDSDSGD